MPGAEERGKYVHVQVRSPEYQDYRTKDIGKLGGMKAVIGIKGSGATRRGEIQKYILDRKDVGVRKGILYAKTPRGMREIRSLRRRKDLPSRILKGY